MIATHKTIKKLSKKYDEDFKASKQPKKQIYVPTKVAPARIVPAYVRPTSAPGHKSM